MPSDRHDDGLDPTLADIGNTMVEVGCRPCARYGRYSRARLQETHGHKAPLLDLLEWIASSCPKAVSGRCKANYLRLERAKPVEQPAEIV
jgi:hypothetical protein